MINLKKVAAFGLAAVMSMSLMVGCGSGSSSQSTGGDSASEGAATESTVATKHHKIGVGLYTDSGKSVEAIKAYLSGISKTVDCEFVYTTLSTYDEATNLTEVQNLISSGLSDGYDPVCHARPADNCRSYEYG